MGMSAEQGDVETIREALDKLDDDGSCMCHDPANTAGYECDWHISQSGLAALDRLAADLERAELALEGERSGAAIDFARAEKAERALAENEQMWEDMRAYNIRLEERAREAERALAEIIAEADELLLWQPGKKGYAVAHKRFYDAIYPYRSSEDTSDES